VLKVFFTGGEQNETMDVVVLRGLDRFMFNELAEKKGFGGEVPNRQVREWGSGLLANEGI
jgi:hypothetical protein